MKSKKIIASVAAMSVLAMSTMSFAAINIANSNITTLTNESTTSPTVNATGTTKIANIVAEKSMTLKGNADLSSTALVTKTGATTTLDGITVGSSVGDVVTDEKQKCETLLYKQAA